VCQQIPRTRVNDPLVSQVVRSSGSVGANYREANESLGKKDFVHRLRIARKESKETHHWLDILIEANPASASDLVNLMHEADELRRILSAIIIKSTTS
jgi:four helix bundle protein